MSARRDSAIKAARFLKSMFFFDRLWPPAVSRAFAKNTGRPEAKARPAGAGRGRARPDGKAVCRGSI
eukprot:707615-Lingulodinium_polyedra.AAC.1